LKKTKVLEFGRNLRFWSIEEMYGSGVLKKFKVLEF